MKPRVPLCGCSPCAVGTPLVESLTGFVSRLAVARHLPSSAIFDRLVRPLVREGVVQQSLQLTSFLVGALSRLTGLPRLSHLTLLPWRGFLAVRSGALRRRPKRWCCRCLAGWRRRGTELREPLLWRVSVVQRCPVHRIPFSELCPRCHGRQGVVSEIIPFGHCRKCGHALEADDPLRRDSSARVRLDVQARWEWWTSVAVGRMLASQRLLARVRQSPGLLGASGPLSRSVRQPLSPPACSVSRRRVELNRGLDERGALSAPRRFSRRLHAARR